MKLIEKKAADSLLELFGKDCAINMSIRQTYEEYNNTFIKFMNETSSYNFLKKKQKDSSEINSIKIEKKFYEKSNPSISFSYSLSTGSNMLEIKLEPYKSTGLITINSGIDIFNTSWPRFSTKQFNRTKLTEEFTKEIKKIYEEKCDGIISHYIDNMLFSEHFILRDKTIEVEKDAAFFKSNYVKKERVYKISHTEGSKKINLIIKEKENIPETNILLLGNSSQFTKLEIIYFKVKEREYALRNGLIR